MLDPAQLSGMTELRELIRGAAPGAMEVISYNMPAFRLYGILLYYAAHRAHIGFYPANAALIRQFREQLEGYETSKGTIRLPLGRPLPAALITAIVKIRVQQNLEKEAAKRKRR